MASHHHLPFASLFLVLILSLLHLQATVITEAASIYFLDSPTRHYLRAPSDVNSVTESDILSSTEVSAAVSVLLGSIPPNTLSDDGSRKLDKVLMPNPFHRPYSVFALEVIGTAEFQHLGVSDSNFLNHALRSQLATSGSKADILLHEDDQVSVINLSNLLNFDTNEGCSERNLRDAASFVGGSYKADNIPLNGEFTISLPSGANLRLDLSKKADKEFITSLVSLARSTGRVIEMHHDLGGSGQIFPELITGKFNGIKALQEHYGTEGVTQHGLELLVLTISKIFDSFQNAYQGEIVGLVIQGGDDAPSQTTSLLNVMVTSRGSARSLEETVDTPDIIAIAEKILVRRIVAWTTGLLLIIATLLGIYFLMSMPLTRDTLLYSNVKLD